MSEKSFNEVFASRLRYYLSRDDMTQKDLAARLGVGTTSVYNWCNGVKTPRMDKVDAMCKLFGCNRFDLIEEPPLNPVTSVTFNLSNEERQLIQHFRAADEPIRVSVRKLLDMPEEKNASSDLVG